MFKYQLKNIGAIFDEIEMKLKIHSGNGQVFSFGHYLKKKRTPISSFLLLFVFEKFYSDNALKTYFCFQRKYNISVFGLFKTKRHWITLNIDYNTQISYHFCFKICLMYLSF